MKYRYLILTLPALLLGTPTTHALSVDDASMNSPAKSDQFSDPDEKTPVPSLHMNMNGGMNKDTSQPVSSVRYDYDAVNGTSVPHSTADDK